MNKKHETVRPHQVHFIVTFSNNRNDRLRVADHYLSKLDFPEGIIDVFTNEAVRRSVRAFILRNIRDTEILESIFVSVRCAEPVPYLLD